MPSWTSSTGQPGVTGMLKEFHVPHASDTTPGIHGRGPDRSRVRIERPGHDQRVRGQVELRGDAPEGFGRSASRSAGSRAASADRPRSPRSARPTSRPSPRRTSPTCLRRSSRPPGVRSSAASRYSCQFMNQRVRRDRGRVGGAPPERAVDRVHPARDVAGQALPLLGRPTRCGLRSDVIAPRVRGHQASPEGRRRPRRPGTPPGPTS